jgi:hypothetical protein
MERKNEGKAPKYFVLTFEELTRLIICVLLDIIEYVAKPLLTPVIGDLFDIVGVGACASMFGWTGLLSFLEFVPGLDILPIFIITWSIWFYLKRIRENRKREEIYKKWK